MNPHSTREYVQLVQEDRERQILEQSRARQARAASPAIGAGNASDDRRARLDGAGGDPSRAPAWRRAARRLSLGAAIVSTLAVVGASTTVAAQPIAVKDIGSFALGPEVGYPVRDAFSIRIAPGSVIDTVSVKVAPKGDFGWHAHNSAVAVAVRAGALTVYDPTTCASQTYGKGQGFIESPHKIHLARNEGAVPAVLTVTYLGIPPGTPADQPMPSTYDPCRGLK